MQINFADNVFSGGTGNKRYALVYVTEVPNLSLSQYTNTATILHEGRSTAYSATTAPWGNHNTFLTKSAAVTGQNVYLDDELLWSIDLNNSLSVIETPEIEDTISAGHVYLNNSLSVNKYLGTTLVPLAEGVDYTKTLESIPVGTPPTGSQTKLKILFNGSVSAKYLITYKTVVTSSTGTLNNTVKFSGANAFERSVTTTQLNANQYSFVSGTTDPLKGNLRILKKDQDTQALVTTGEAVFELYYLLNGQKRVIGGDGATLTTTQGQLDIKNLSFRTYYLKEISEIGRAHV